mmetsp:Transcript_15159/g.20006  ORF Transcript_15159/g.20006 Transcript_15159/m.20006 type:complete len:1017 (+) Transcript_15159:58-3108(+)
MDIDLFGAFDGEEVVENVEEVEPVKTKAEQAKQDEQSQPAKKKPKTQQNDPKPFEIGPQVNISEKRQIGEGLKSVISFSAVPVDYKPPPVPEVPPKPAKEYSYKLDPFQEQAVGYIEKGESVLVSAHTSAGKTAVAEYAIAKSLRDRQRVIYTSPIKALSNQKFRDLQEEFTDVGLMTGDITINPSATCIIMTTEILRSMLYRGSEMMREVAWVIYDEIHYMRDKERGVVWEESIILLPHNVRYVFLSATIPNSKEFVGWIAKLHHQPCHVVYTNYRPTPLQHYVFPAGGDGLYMVVDEKSRFRDDNFQKAMAFLADAAEEESTAEEKSKGKKDQKKGGSDVFRIVRLIMERNYDPVIVFSFAKRECEAYAMQMAKLDLNEESEKELVESVYYNAMDSLSDEDKALPQVQALLPLLKRGVGIHHGGLLPILKEIVEILFQEGLIKVLFATETFSIGINMPAKTVVFTNTRKYDGNDFRWITSGEYIQMSGRAGRRGKDDRGIVIQMLDEKMEPDVAKDILYGEADALYSSYHISYNMLLNMLRVEGADPEYLIKCSFHQYQQESAAPALEQEADELEKKANEIVIRDEPTVEEYYGFCKEVDRAKDDLKSIVMQPENILPFLQTGRLIQCQDEHTGDDLGWGAMINYNKTDGDNKEVLYRLDVLLNEPKDESKKQPESEPEPEEEEGKKKKKKKKHPLMTVQSVRLDCVTAISAVRLFLPQDLRPDAARAAAGKSIREVQKRFPDQVPLLDPVEDMGLKTPAFKSLQERMKTLEGLIKGNALSSAADKDELFLKYTQKVEMQEKAKVLRREARSSKHMVMKDELKHMKRVLRRLGYCDQDNVIQLKGRVACEVNTADELVVTELIFNGVFNDLTPQQCVAVLSAMVFGEKTKGDPPRLRDELQGPYRQLQEAARHVAKAAVASKIQMDPDEYADSFLPDMMEVTYAWCQGMKFIEVMKLTDIFEGSIIRALRRLEEFMRQLANAAHAIGSMQLKEKFEEGGNLIRRDIVFAASLYL